MKIIPWPRWRGLSVLRALLVATMVTGLVLAGAGTATVLAEHRLSALAPGGVDFTHLSYNPFTGALQLSGVRARDIAGRTIFTSPRVAGRVDLGGVLSGHMGLRGLDVMSPRIVVASTRADVVDLAEGRVWPLLNSLRRYEWPRGIAVIDSLSLTRPAWSGLGVASSGVTIDDAGVVVTQSVAEPTPLDGLLAAVETASRAYQRDAAAGRAGADGISSDFPGALPRLP